MCQCNLNGNEINVHGLVGSGTFRNNPEKYFREEIKPFEEVNGKVFREFVVEIFIEHFPS